MSEGAENVEGRRGAGGMEAQQVLSAGLPPALREPLSPGSDETAAAQQAGERDPQSPERGVWSAAKLSGILKSLSQIYVSY